MRILRAVLQRVAKLTVVVLIISFMTFSLTSLLPGDRLVVCRAPTPLRLVRFPGQTFFSTLRRKLGWGDLEGRASVQVPGVRV